MAETILAASARSPAARAARTSHGAQPWYGPEGLRGGWVGPLAVVRHDPQQSLLQRGLRADVDFSADRHDGAVLTGADTQRQIHSPTLTAPAAGSHPRHG